MLYMYLQRINLSIVAIVVAEYSKTIYANLNMSYLELWERLIMNKYRNKKVVIDNILFDSKKEANYYTKLKILRDAGKISGLRLQEKFILQPSFKLHGKTYRAITYVADFVYKDDKGMHVVDTKGYRTQVYKIKKKLFVKKFGIEIEEM